MGTGPDGRDERDEARAWVARRLRFEAWLDELRRADGGSPPHTPLARPVRDHA